MKNIENSIEQLLLTMKNWIQEVQSNGNKLDKINKITIEISCDELIKLAKECDDNYIRSAIHLIVNKINFQLESEAVDFQIINKDIDKLLTHFNNKLYDSYNKLVSVILEKYEKLSEELYFNRDMSAQNLFEFEQNNKWLELMIVNLGSNDTSVLKEVLNEFNNLLKETYKMVLEEENGQFRNFLSEKDYAKKNRYIDASMYFIFWRNKESFLPVIYSSKDRLNFQYAFNEILNKLNNFINKTSNFVIYNEDIYKAVKVASDNYFYEILINGDNIKLPKEGIGTTLPDELLDNYNNIGEKIRLLTDVRNLEKELIVSDELNIDALRKIMKLKKEYSDLKYGKLVLSTRTNRYICMYKAVQKFKLVVNKINEKCKEIDSKKR